VRLLLRLENDKRGFAGEGVFELLIFTGACVEDLPGCGKCPMRMPFGRMKYWREYFWINYSVYLVKEMFVQVAWLKGSPGGFLEMHTIKGTVHQIFKAFL
jgi:hypothetical protein